MRTLVSLREYVLTLRGMTFSELQKEYPNTFNVITPAMSKDECVKNLLANDAILWSMTGDYAKFISKPPTRGQFVPCNDKGEPITEPTRKEFIIEANEKCSDWEYIPEYLEGTERKYYDAGAYNKAVMEYQKAKEKVIFEGFEKYDELGVKHKNWSNDKYIWFWDGGITVNLDENTGEYFMAKTIEDLTPLGLKYREG